MVDELQRLIDERKKKVNHNRIIRGVDEADEIIAILQAETKELWRVLMECKETLAAIIDDSCVPPQTQLSLIKKGDKAIATMALAKIEELERRSVKFKRLEDICEQLAKGDL